jgi:succinate-acetate transporter protein
LSGLQLGWLAASEGRNLALVLIAFVFPLQLVACIFGYLGRDVVAGTGMGVLAGTWLSIGLVTLTSAPGATSDALGLFLVVAGCAMVVPAAGAPTGKLIAFAVLGTTALRFVITGLYQLTAGSGWEDAAGAVGLVLGALYAAAAMTLEDARRETLLPLLRRGAGRASLERSFDEQLAGIEHEAGVREQL